MRSAETSGVRAGGFDPSKPTQAGRKAWASSLSAAVSAQLSKLSTTSKAAALTALAAAAIFVAADVVRTLGETQDRLHLIASSIADDLESLSPNLATDVMSRAVRSFDPKLEAALFNSSGTLLASTYRSLGTRGASTGSSAMGQVPSGISDRVPAGNLGTLAVTLDTGTALAGIWQRGLAAFGVALLAIGFTLRPREKTDSEEAAPDFQSVVDAVPFGLACWTGSGHLLACNEQYRARLHLADTTLPPGSSYHGAVKQLAQGGYIRMVNEDDNNRLLELHRDDGSCLLIDERPMAAGGFLTLLTDVTERKKTDLLLASIREEQRHLARRYHEEKLRAEAASRSKTNFLAHLSHDIRTPLNHIIGFAELMQHQTYGSLGDQRYLTYVESIKASGERLLLSFATILELAELEGGQKVLREDPVDIDQLLGMTADRFRGQATRAGLGFVVGSRCEAILMADRLCLQRMLGNILENAIRFTPAGGRITLAAFAASDGVVLEVSDTGLGMSEERLQSLSQPFALGDAAFTREHGGAGLGIAIARAIAELSGGRLAIDSSPAMGTTVAISLPLKKAAAGRRAA